jgi:N,N'-diacetyllegionaminate synthase
VSRKVLIVAEAGCNHNGSLELARKLVDLAADAGADAVKFQAFRSEKLASRFAAQAEYQKENTGVVESQLEMLKKLELGEAAHRDLVRHCRTRKITYLCTPFDLESIDLLVRLRQRVFKIPSGEITNLPYLRKMGMLRKRIIMSTGMADMTELRAALAVLVKAGTRKDDITVLHCNTEYPTPYKDANLNAMTTIAKTCGVAVGYSDHTPGIEVSLAAVALGACVVEKHFTLDKDMAGPDHKASLDRAELFSLVQGIRNVEKALGTSIKKASPSEKKNITIARKSIVAARPIDKGERLTSENITTKRPALGISPMRWDSVIGRKARRRFEVDELIEL